MKRKAVSLGEEYTVFYTEVGVTLTTWAAIEVAICIVVSVCLTKSNPATLMAGYFGIENFRSKLKFADEMVSEELTDANKKSLWDKLHKRASALSIARNKLVHRMATSVHHMPAGKRISLLHPNYFRTPPSAFVNSKGKPKLPEDSLTIAEICALKMKMVALHEALLQFAKHLQGGSPPLLEPLEQPVVPPKIEDLIGRIRSALELPPQPSRRSRKRIP